ncbi:MAG: SDR family oxidoreductase [Lactobacillales bacterium]|nr:SDR family oxidoreductase [Lactobacillales bacterium]
MRKKDLTNKVVLITGASSGLGEELAYAFAETGAILVLVARRIDELRRVQKNVRTLTKQKVFIYSLDLSQPSEIDTVVSSIEDNVGAVDVLVNNAGFGLFKEFLSIDDKVMREMFEVNVLGMISLTQKLAKKMLTKEQGHIINVASMAGKLASQKSTIYSATKFAVIGFSNALRLEFAPLGILVTTVNPGPIRTHFFDRADETGDYLKKIGSLALDPKKLAKEIVQSVGKNRREINRPMLMEGTAKFSALFPKLTDFLSLHVFNLK